MADATLQAEFADSKPRSFTDAIDEMHVVLFEMKCVMAAIDRAVGEAPIDDADTARVIGHIDTYNRILVGQLERAHGLSTEVHTLGRA